MDWMSTMRSFNSDMSFIMRSVGTVLLKSLVDTRLQPSTLESDFRVLMSLNHIAISQWGKMCSLKQNDAKV